MYVPIRSLLLSTALLLLLAAGAHAGTLTAFTDHSGENHQNENHSGELLMGIILDGGSLRNSILDGTDFTGGSFVGTQLRNGSFVGTIFDGADLTGANIRDADFTGASFLGADLSNANEFNRVASWSGAFFDSYTLFPTGFNAGNAGMIFVAEPAETLLLLSGLGGLGIFGRRRRQVAG